MPHPRLRRFALGAGMAAMSFALAAPLGAQGEARFDPEAVRAHVTFLADDLLEGRATGARGYDIAASYVASRFIEIGAKPMGDASGGSYFQQVPLREARLSSAPTLTLRAGASELRLENEAQFLLGPSLFEQQQQVEAPLVFVGYRLDRPDLGLRDYDRLDVAGKIVVVLSGYPKGLNTELGAHLNSEKAVMAMNRGAIGILSIPTLQDTQRRPWARRAESAKDPAVGWLKPDGAPFARAPGIRVNGTLNPDAMEPLFAGTRRTLAAVLAEADRVGGKPRGFSLSHRATVERNSTWQPIASANVVAMIPGSDPALANEYVLMTAHLDHMENHGEGPDRIFNGAMDNAAGVATMLEVARALAQDGQRPRRPVLFAALTGEEKGLLGADYLSRFPVVAPAGQVVAVVNFDMPVLTYPFTDVVAFGAENSTLGPTVAAAARQVGIALSPDPIPEEGIFTRSDHYRFVQLGVPAVFLMTGFAGPGERAFRDFLATHYHRPSDDLNRPFDWAAGARFAEVNYHIVRAIADGVQRPQWYAGNFFGDEFAPQAAKAPRPAP